jgi:hypothetical protein
MRALVATLLVLVGIASPSAAALPHAPAGNDVSVTIDRSKVHTQIGRRFSFSTSIRNDGDRPLPGWVAHLNVLSVDPDVYVDPEDWSPQRTVYLEPIPAHGSVDVPWRVQAVNDGRFVLYVAVTTRSAPGDVVVSDGLRLSATTEQTINAGGVLPVILGVPAALLVLMLLNGARRRRLR